MEIVSLRERPELLERATDYFVARWANEQSRAVYVDCLSASLKTVSPLPQWYLLLDGDKTAGGAGLITNDFVSRMDLWPWVAARYVEPEYRCHGWGKKLLERAENDARASGYPAVYLVTDHTAYYERYGYVHIGTGYHPWGGSSRIYKKAL